MKLVIWILVLAYRVELGILWDWTFPSMAALASAAILLGLLWPDPQQPTPGRA